MPTPAYVTVPAAEGRFRRRPGAPRFARRFVIGAVVVTLAAALVLWLMLDFEAGIVGVADVVALPDGGAAVAWTDLSGNAEARLLVVDASGQRVSVEELHRDRGVVGMVASLSGTLAVAQQESLTSGSITLLDAGRADRRDLVRPADVPYNTQMLILGDELLWTSSHSNGGGLEATNLTTGATRRLVATGNFTFDFTALSDGRTVALVDQGDLVVVDTTSGDVTRTGDSQVVSAAASGDRLAFIIKEGESKILKQCPGDSGPGTDGPLRVGHLMLWEAGTATALEVDLGDQQATSVESIGRSDQALVSAVGADDKGCPDDPSLYRIDLTTGQLTRVVTEHDGGVGASEDGQVAYLNDGSLFVRLPDGTVEEINPAGTDALNGFAWTEDGALWFVSDMDVDRKGRDEPRLWVRSPAGGVEAKETLG